MDLLEADILGESIDTHWYYVSKGRALQDFVGKSFRCDALLDVGAGSGFFAKFLLAKKTAGAAVCVDPNYEKNDSKIVHGKSIEFVRSVETVSQRFVLMMDVLEHVQDDVSFLKDYAQKMPAGADVMITVPAFSFLWSGHDVFLKHYRRYTAISIEQCARAAGLEIVKTRYFFGLLFPVGVMIRMIDKLSIKAGGRAPRSGMSNQSRFLNSVLIAIHDLERHILFRYNRLAGMSVFCLCRKPQDTRL